MAKITVDGNTIYIKKLFKTERINANFITSIKFDTKPLYYSLGCAVVSFFIFCGLLNSFALGLIVAAIFVVWGYFSVKVVINVVNESPIKISGAYPQMKKLYNELLDLIAKNKQ